MGTPINHLQELTGHHPSRFIGTDELKDFYFDIATPAMGYKYNVNVKKIDGDDAEWKAHLASGSFTPALREVWDLKSFVWGRQQQESLDFPEFATAFTGAPRGEGIDRPDLAYGFSGRDEGLVRELGYIQFHRVHGNIIPYWHEEGFIHVPRISGSMSPTNWNHQHVSYALLEGSIYGQEAPHEPSVHATTGTEVNISKISYVFYQGTYQGG
jgi:hypothetical protein